MASSIASYINLNQEHTWAYTLGESPAINVDFQSFPLKLTAVDKIGGILCYVCGSTFGNKKALECHFVGHNRGNVVYTCVACQKQHSTYASYRNHVYLQHIIKHKFPCPQCDKSFSKQTALKYHIKAIHEFKCSDCDAKFTTKKDLELHKIIHNKKGTSNPPYECIKCKELIRSIDECEEHINEHYEVLYPCPICSMSPPSIEETVEHISVHFDEKTTLDITTMKDTTDDSSINALGGIMCCHCDLIFKNRSDIDSHFASQHEEKVISYTCNICDKQYTSYPAFGNHCYLHIAKDKFQCDQCHKLFPRLSLLVMHNLAFHSTSSSEKPFRCDKCIHGFESHYRLMNHKNIVHDETTLKCLIPQCSAKFNTPRELVSHQVGHRSCLDNWCRQCGLQFATRAACERHLLVHRHKRYACPVCARPYLQRYHALQHLPKHFESVLHICKVCGKSYNQRNRLIEHAARSHSVSSRKYKCSHCAKAFARPYECEQHERVHTGAKPYSCAVCQRDFASYPNWTKHLTRKHAYDKDMIRQAREARNQAIATTTCSSSKEYESEIKSANGEVTDLGLSEDSADDGQAIPGKKSKLQSNLITRDGKLENTIENDDNSLNRIECVMSMPVTAVIHRIDIDEHFNEAKLNQTSDFISKETVRFTECSEDLDMIATNLNETSDFTEETTKFIKHTEDLDSMKSKFKQTADFMTVESAKYTEHTEQLDLIGANLNRPDFIIEETAKFAQVNEGLDLINAKLTETADFTEQNSKFTEHAETLDLLEVKLGRTAEFIVAENDKFAENTEFTSEFSALDDSSVIKAIVEHIDALSGDLELAAPPADLQFAELGPGDHATYDPVPAYSEPQYCQPSRLPPEYGPDFNTLGSEVYTSDIIDLNDHVLPHIDPLLTIKEQNAMLFAQKVQNNLYESGDSGSCEPSWGEPIITKVYSYNEPNDINRMYELNGDIF